MANVHNVRCWPQFYSDVESGKKPFDIRKNDRKYKVNDILHLQEYEPNNGYSGACCLKEITYILDEKFIGVQPGFVVLGLRNVI